MKRWFSLALVLAMCLTTIIGDIPVAIAENEGYAAEDAVLIEDYEQSAGEGEDEFISDDDAIPAEDGSADDITADEYEAVPGGDAAEGILDDAESGVDFTPEEDAEEVAAPAPWYARAIASLTLAVDDTVSRNIPQDSVLLVTEAVSDTMLHVVCADLSGDVDTGLLVPLTEDEIRAFMDALTDAEVSFYQDMPDYPLPPAPAEIPVDATVVIGAQPAEEGADTVSAAGPDGQADIVENPEGAAEDEAAGTGDDTEEADKTGDANADDGEEEAEGGETDAESADGAEVGTEVKADGDGTESGDEANADETTTEGEADADNAKAEDDAESVKAESEETETRTEASDAAEKAEGEEAAEDAETVEVLEAAEGEETAEKAAADESAAPAEASDPQTAEANAPTGIAFNLSSLTMGVKEVYTGLTASVVNAGGTALNGYAVGWRSSNVRVVKVAADGALTAVRTGKATIIASVSGLPEATITVIVKKAPSDISVTPRSQKISAGMVLQLVPKLSGGSASGRLTYISSNPAVATVNENGLVTGVAGGKATITVRTYNNKRAACKVTVYGPPVTMTLDKPSYALLQGKSQKMIISLLDAAGAKTYANLSIVSSDPNVVAVDAAGNLTGVNLGTATVTVTTHNGLSTSCIVDVAGPAADMALSASTITIGVREKYDRLTYTLVPPAGQEKCAASVTWKSKNKKIAKVNRKTGVITGVKVGTTTIVATTNNKISRSVKVVVRKAPKSVSISPKEMALTIGMTGQLTASYNAKNVSANITYTSSDPAVVSVNQNGVVTAVGRGSAVITARTYNGRTDTCTVNIYNDPAQVMMSETLTVAVGSQAQLSCSVVDAGGQPSTASYSYTVIPETGNVEVDGNGVVKGVSVGTARVRVSTQNGVTTHMDGQGLPVVTECVVTIEEAPPVRYRVFSVYDFYNVPAKGSLTFPMNNATGFMEVFSNANVSGIQYENVGLLENPSKSSLLSGLASAFSGSCDTDVNLIYLCSHGTNYVDVAKTAKSTHYGLQLPGYLNYKSSSDYYITSEELFSAISAIKGKVVLVLDSCYSGQFIANIRSALNAQDGRISVMTAANNTTACYYNIADTSTACDFFTMYLLIGAGYNIRTHSRSGAYPADANKDGKLTFSELFSYAKKSVRANVPKYKNKSWFHGNYKQSPTVFTGTNGDLVLLQYS